VTFYFFSLDLNDAGESAAVTMFGGEFQVVGAVENLGVESFRVGIEG